MKCFVAACVAALCLVGFMQAQDKKEEKKIDAAKIVGKWDLAKSDDKGPDKATVEFTKDGKISLSFDLNGKQVDLTGKYSVKGDQLTVAISLPGEKEGKEQSDTIKTLTDDTLVIVNKAGKETEFKKKK